jgi:hypothetical protein
VIPVFFVAVLLRVALAVRRRFDGHAVLLVRDRRRMRRGVRPAGVVGAANGGSLTTAPVIGDGDRGVSVAG